MKVTAIWTSMAMTIKNVVALKVGFPAIVKCLMDYPRKSATSSWHTHQIVWNLIPSSIAACQCQAKKAGKSLPELPRQNMRFRFLFFRMHYCTITYCCPAGLLQLVSSLIIEWLQVYIYCFSFQHCRPKAALGILSRFKHQPAWARVDGNCCKDLEKSRFLKRVWRIGFSKEAKEIWLQQDCAAAWIMSSKSLHQYELHEAQPVVHLRSSRLAAWHKLDCLRLTACQCQVIRMKMKHICCVVVMVTARVCQESPCTFRRRKLWWQKTKWFESSRNPAKSFKLQAQCCFWCFTQPGIVLSWFGVVCFLDMKLKSWSK